MKTVLAGIATGLLLAVFPLTAQNTADQTSAPSPAETVSPSPALPEIWGKVVDPDGDCRFKADQKALTITVPGSARAHELSAEINAMNAPRVMRPVNGDFKMQVTVQGLFAPGNESTQPGRTGYTGAGILLFADDRNYVRLERATLHWGDDDSHDYVNFEMRLNGRLVRLGTTADRPITSKGPLHLRLERKGSQLHGYVSDDGQIWDEMEPKEIPDNWPSQMQIGFAAISTSRFSFEPAYLNVILVSEPVVTVPEPGTLPQDSASAPSAADEKQK